MCHKHGPTLFSNDVLDPLQPLWRDIPAFFREAVAPDIKIDDLPVDEARDSRCQLRIQLATADPFHHIGKTNHCAANARFIAGEIA